MNDLISRQDAIDKIFEVYEYEFPTASGEFDEFATVIIPNLLRNLPSAEPEQKKGKWDFVGDNMFKCTCCGVLYTTHQLNILRNYDTDPYAPYYCPHCGADMRDKDE